MTDSDDFLETKNGVIHVRMEMENKGRRWHWWVFIEKENGVIKVKMERENKGKMIEKKGVNK